jgi:hypothetical protein
MEVMQNFVGLEGCRTLFMIECIHGKSIQSHSFYKDENEILLMPGTYLRVIGKWSPANDLYIIHLQEETPPYQLVAPPFTSSSSVNTLPVKKFTTSKTSQPDYQAASIQSVSKSFCIFSHFLKRIIVRTTYVEDLRKRKKTDKIFIRKQK